MRNASKGLKRTSSTERLTESVGAGTVTVCVARGQEGPGCVTYPRCGTLHPVEHTVLPQDSTSNRTVFSDTKGITKQELRTLHSSGTCRMGVQVPPCHGTVLTETRHFVGNAIFF